MSVERFERAYTERPDPWAFATSPYEQRRYDLTVAALPRARYRRAFEPGCSIGELTGRLARRCDEVVAWDVAPTAIATAAERLGLGPEVQFGVGLVPGSWPEGPFDLVVLAEIGYYLTADELDEVARRARVSLEAGGTLAAVHWRGVAEDQVQHGDEVHRRLEAAIGAPPFGRYVEEAFRLDVWDVIPAPRERG